MAGREYRYKTIPTSELQVGMYVEDVGRTWLQHPWLKKSRLLTSRREIQRLLDYGIKEVVVNLSLGVLPKSRPAADETEEKPPPQKIEEVERRTGVREVVATEPVPLEVELPRVRDAFQVTTNSVRYIVDSLQTEKSLKLKVAEHVVEEVIASVLRNQDAFLTLAKVRQYEKYDIQHPLLVTVLSVSFGRYLGMDKEQLRELGLGAMLQDVGKVLIPLEIINKPGRLDDREREVVKKHSLLGARLLKDSAHLPPRALALALYHHERLDGSGYPKGLQGEQLGPNVIICGLADVFDALTTDRVYKKGCLPYHALGELFQMRGRLFPETWVDRFIHCLGIYPTGTVAELNTGETAVVLGVNHAQLLRPRIKLITDSQGRPLMRQRSIDLNTETHAHRSIRKVLDPKKVGVDPALYIEPQV
ncbi:MAG: HD-GYP domain-containing protein [Thermodesulfobacteriota bacterium]